MPSIIVGNRQFKTQKALQEFIRGILNMTGAGNWLSPEDHDFFSELIKRHPEYYAKAGNGVKSFQVVRNEVNTSGLAIIIHRIDGSSIDISWLTCVSGVPKKASQNLRSALRQAVGSQVMEFRKKRLVVNPTCERCGCDVSSDSHVDHDIPFEKIVNDFLKIEPDPPLTFDDSPKGEMAIFKSADHEYMNKWIEYHLENAKLILSCEKCNLSRKKK